MSQPPERPKLYHIVHVDKLTSIVADGSLWCDAVMVARTDAGTTIGMDEIKQRRLNQLVLSSRPGLRVGECVPFYFCPRSVMLYLIWMRNHPGLAYRGGQEPIVHLEADLHEVVAWAESNRVRWAFTLSNAGARYFEDRCSLEALSDVDWDAVAADKWSGPGISPAVKHGKQAEFLVERQVPWDLVARVGVFSPEVARQVADAVGDEASGPSIEVRSDWYY